MSGALALPNLLLDAGYGSATKVYGCRAWIVYNALTNEIKNSGNISSVTKNGQGYFTYNLTNAMPDIMFAVVAGEHNSDDGTGQIYPAFNQDFVKTSAWSYTTSSFRSATLWGNNTLHDPGWLSLAVIR